MTDDGMENHGANTGTWNRGDGQPDPRLLDEALTRILQVCDPAEVILFGSAARGELRDGSDLDLLIVEDDPSTERDTERLVRDAIEHLPKADVMTATRSEMREAEGSLSRIHRTIATEGVTLYRNGRRLPCLPRPRPARDDTPADLRTARAESEQLADFAARRLDAAHTTNRVRMEMCPSPGMNTCDRTRIAGLARKATEFALQAVIVCAEQRPHAWKDPAGLAAEARAAGAAIPAVDPAALERAGKHCTGHPFPGDPGPSEEEMREALELADRIVPWARETVHARHAGGAQPDDGAAQPETTIAAPRNAPRQKTGPTRCC